MTFEETLSMLLEAKLAPLRTDLRARSSAHQGPPPSRQANWPLGARGHERSSAID